MRDLVALHNFDIKKAILYHSASHCRLKRCVGLFLRVSFCVFSPIFANFAIYEDVASNQHLWYVPRCFGSG